MSTAFLPEMTPELNLPSPSPETTDPLRAAAVLNPALLLLNRAAAAIPAKATARSRRATRRARVNWEAILVVALMLSCAAVGLYRLIWMGQI